MLLLLQNGVSTFDERVVYREKDTFGCKMSYCKGLREKKRGVGRHQVRICGFVCGVFVRKSRVVKDAHARWLVKYPLVSRSCRTLL